MGLKHERGPAVTREQSPAFLGNSNGRLDFPGPTHKQLKYPFWSAGTAKQAPWTFSSYLQIYLASKITQTTLHFVSRAAEFGKWRRHKIYIKHQAMNLFLVQTELSIVIESQLTGF